MPPRKPSEPGEQPECRADETTEITVPIDPGTPTTVEIPPGTTNLTIIIDSSLQPRPQSQGLFSGFMRGCGCAVLTVCGALVFLLAIGWIVAR